MKPLVTGIAALILALSAGCHLRPDASGPKATRQAGRVAAQVAGSGIPNAVGLQMTAERPSDAAYVLCVIHNRSGRAVRYYRYFLDYWEAVSLRARPAGSAQWVKVPYRDVKNRPVFGYGPAGSDRVIGPGEKIFWRTDDFVRGKRGRSETDTVSWPEGSPATLPSKRFLPATGAVETSTMAPYSLRAYFGDFDWPRAWSGDIEVQVGQHLSVYPIKEDTSLGGVWNGTLRSGTLLVPIKVLRQKSPPSKVPMFTGALAG